MVWLFDEQVTREQERLFEEDMGHCREVTLAELDGLSFPVRFRNLVMRLLSYFI